MPGTAEHIVQFWQRYEEHTAMAAEIEHPFGLASHDLALEAICKTIERNLLEVMKRVEGRDLGA